MKSLKDKTDAELVAMKAALAGEFERLTGGLVAGSPERRREVDEQLYRVKWELQERAKKGGR